MALQDFSTASLPENPTATTESSSSHGWQPPLPGFMKLNSDAITDPRSNCGEYISNTLNKYYFD